MVADFGNGPLQLAKRVEGSIPCSKSSSVLKSTVIELWIEARIGTDLPSTAEKGIVYTIFLLAVPAAAGACIYKVKSNRKSSD